MNATVKQALDKLKLEPCKTYGDQLVHAVNESSESDRRMAIDVLEGYVRVRGNAPYDVVSTLSALRRAI